MSVSKGSSSKNPDKFDSDVPFFPSPHHEGEAMLESPSAPRNFSASTTPELQLPRSQRTTVSSIKSFASSPLNPTGPTSFPTSPFNRSGSRGSTYINRIASEECRALASHHSIKHSGSRGSMILYRRADLTPEDVLLPPTRSHLSRNSILSVSGDSIVSLSSDSKYPARTIASDRGLIAYAYDPSLDELSTAMPADDDFLHDPDDKFPPPPGLLPSISARGVKNILALVALVAAILCLFVVYPVIRFYHDNTRNLLITFNTRINATGQAEMVIVNRRSQILLAAPIPLIDSSTPLPARILKTAQDIIYELVFSDEFTQNGRSFSADKDPIWEAASSSASAPSQINTKDGSLLLRLDTLPVQVQDRRWSRSRYNRGGSGSGSGRGGRTSEGREKEQSGMYMYKSLSGILKMKVPLCLSRGGFVEVRLRKRSVGLDSWPGLGSGSKREGVEKEGNEGAALRRLIYWPGSLDTWSSLNQSDIPNIPADVLTSSSDSGTSLTLSIGIPIDDPGRTMLFTVGSPDSEAWDRERWRTTKSMEVEVDYVRIYRPTKSSLSSMEVVIGPEVEAEKAIWECAAARDDYVVLDLFDV